MKALIESAASANVTLVKGSGGVFEIERDGNLVYSKKASGRFQTDDELAAFTTG